MHVICFALSLTSAASLPPPSPSLQIGLAWNRFFLPKYPLSNSCGQLEQSYQDYVCPEGYEFMQCDVDPNMEQKASTQANCKLEGSFLCFFSFILIYIHFHSSLPFQGTVHQAPFFVDLNQSIHSQDIGIMGTCAIFHGETPLSSVRIILDKRVARP